MNLITDRVSLMFGDCLERLKEIESGSVDMVLADPPYGTTANKWDSVIPFVELWAELDRVTKKNGAVIMTSSQPFTSVLVLSNLNNFKYTWVWEKSRFANQMLAKKQPLKIHEDVVVFCKGTAPYIPQGLTPLNKTTTQGARVSDNIGGGTRKTSYTQSHTNYPRSIQRFKSAGKTVHPTQKPVPLFEYLIKTYTNEDEVVPDFTMGSGTTGVAAVNTGRKFIGIELDPNYYGIACGRIMGAENGTN